MAGDQAIRPQENPLSGDRLKLQPADAFIDKLTAFGQLNADDEQRLRNACHQVRSYKKSHSLIREGDQPGPVFVVLEGWACRYKILSNGNRQIIAFMLPGDFCDMHVGLLDEMDHNIETLTPALIATIQRPEMEALVESSPTLIRAFWWTQLVDSAMLRSTIVSLGRRNSLERVSHLLCELCLRTHDPDRIHSRRYVMPFSQVVLADAVGLTPVHVNRVLRRLREEGALELGGTSMTICDISVLARIAGFDANYLHQRLSFKQL